MRVCVRVCVHVCVRARVCVSVECRDYSNHAANVDVLAIGHEPGRRSSGFQLHNNNNNNNNNKNNNNNNTRTGVMMLMMTDRAPGGEAVEQALYVI